MSHPIKTRIVRIEELLMTVRHLVEDLRNDTDLILRPTLAALDQVTDALDHATERTICIKCFVPSLPGSQLCAKHWAEIRDQPLETAGNMFRACDAKERTP